MAKFKFGDKITPVYQKDLPSGTHPWLVFEEIYTVTRAHGIGWVDIHGTFAPSACPVIKNVEWSEDWFELYEEKETEMTLTNSMTVEQIRDEILRIETRIEEAKKDIENAEKERNSLVEKLREKGFELTYRAPTNSHSQKLAVGHIVRILSYNEEYHPENYTNHNAKIIKTDSSDRPYLVEVGGSEFWCTPEEVEKI